MTYRLSAAELAESRARYAQQTAKLCPAAPPPAPGYVYQPRTQAQWERRIEQTWQSNRTFRPKPVPAPTFEDDPEIQTDGDESDTGEPRSKVSSATPCIDCGHPRKDHHIAPEPHTVDGEHAYYCVTSHCAVMRYENGQHVDCACQHFRAQETDMPKLTRARVGPYDRCANPACGHWKIDHCTKAKPGKAGRLKPGEMAYRILSKPDGTGSYPCKHFSLTDSVCQCTSASCSATPDGKEFCSCEAFQNPWLVRKTKATARKKRVSEPAVASLASAATDSTPESVLVDSPARPRRSRKRKTAFVTGAGELFSPPAVEATDVPQ